MPAAEGQPSGVLDHETNRTGTGLFDPARDCPTLRAVS
ncbi:hypothetical protein CGRA01v4_07621 [Colletotrichum graminicola]|nr:hypothetical protein CGRA01v4_07621 [Colletotrichum graminicola]